MPVRMERLPLFRFNSRAKATSLGMALCAMFLVASFSIVSGLTDSMDALTGSFGSDFSLVTKDITGSAFPQNSTDLVAVLDKSALGYFERMVYEPQDLAFLAVAIVDEHSILPEGFPVSGNQTLRGEDLPLPAKATIYDYYLGPVDVEVVGTYSSILFPSDWLICSHEFLTESQVGAPYLYNFAISKDLTEEEASELRSMGYSVDPLTSIGSFLRSGTEEIESSAFLVLVPSSFIVAVLAYSFIGSEVADRRHDIGIIKTIGAGRRRIFAYIFAEAGIICAWGGLLGLALGIVLSYAISTAASVAFTSAFSVEMSEPLLLLAYVSTVAAGLAGALPQAVRMAFTTPVADLKEGVQ